MSEHTKGPWAIFGDEIITDDSRRVAEISDYNGFEDWPSDQVIGNAHLIASAPDMQEALEAMVEAECNYMRINNLGDPEEQHGVRRARAALAKSRGES